jgi:hypothetical protein
MVQPSQATRREANPENMRNPGKKIAMQEITMEGAVEATKWEAALRAAPNLSPQGASKTRANALMARPSSLSSPLRRAAPSRSCVVGGDDRKRANKR